jgi:MYND finger
LEGDVSSSHDKTTFDEIQRYAADLVHLSESLQTWQASEYSKNLRFYNSESLELVREFWGRYSSPNNLTSSFIHNYNNAIKKIYETYHKNVKSTDTIATTTKKFWASGAAASPASPNLLFAYTNSGSRFAVHPESNPMRGFHLTPAVAHLAPGSPLYQPHLPGSINLDRAISSAKMQFEDWCNAFRRVIKKDDPPRLVIRFFVGDAISFCLGLQAQRDPAAEVINCYSRPGTARMLRLDDKDKISERFDVIDTGYLVDRVGSLNLLPHVAQLLQNSCSVLYTSTLVANIIEEFDLLSEMLMTNCHGIMCTVLGIVPAAYLNGTTSQAYHEYHDSRPHMAIPLTNRIMWVMTKAGGHMVQFNRVTPTCDMDSILKFLFVLYKYMFEFEMEKTRQLNGSHAYTKYTFATLLRYFKQRMFGIDWKQCVMTFLAVLFKDSEVEGTTAVGRVLPELFAQIALCDVYVGGFSDILAGPSIPLLGLRNPPDPCAMVITVPRSKLHRIYDKLSTDASRTPIAFQLYMRNQSCGDKDCKCVEECVPITCVQTVFGKLVVSANGKSATIEEDQSKWDGMSDLHVCGYFSSQFIRAWGNTGDKQRPFNFGVALARTRETVKLFEPELGKYLEVWNTGLGHTTDSVHFFDRLPGLKRPVFKEFSFVRDTVAETTNSFVVDFPVLDFEKPSFMTHIKVIGPALNHLQKKENLSVNQHSPCTLTVTFGPFQVQGNYNFPVDGPSARLRVSRANGWIEIIAPFIDPTRRGFFTSTPFPVLLSPWLTFYNTFRPYVNFRQLPRLDWPLANRDTSGNETASIPTHLVNMLTNNELSAHLPMSKIKFRIHTLLFPSPKPTVFRLKSQNSAHVDILFFIAGLYLDSNSRSVVGEGYIMPITPDGPTILPANTELKCYVDEMIWWKSALFAMVEQARMWKHEPTCVPQAAVPICRCGLGQVTSTFTDVKAWRKYAPYVTPIAISPIFPAPWLDETRRNIPEVRQAAINSGGIGDVKECKVCGKVGARKKCGGCMNAVYCSRECQVTDWREHKTSCASASKG